MKKIRFLLLTLVALLGGVVSSQGKTVYVDPVGASTWMTDNPAISLYVFGDGDGWATSETLSDGVIKFTFDDKYTKMIIVRGPQANANSFDNKWNQTADITSIEVGKLYKANGYDNGNLAYTIENYTEPAPAPGYTVDFNTAITTSNHDFKVAKGWGHIVGENNYDGQGPYYMSYSYSSTTGVDGTGALSANRQYAGDNWGGDVCYDLLVTPTVNGTVKLDVKASISASSSNNAFVEVYAINADGTRGELLKTIKEDIAGYSSGSNTVWATFTLAELTSEQKLGLRCQYVYIDNFTATSVNIPAERKLEVTKVANLQGYDATGGTTTYYEQQADGTLKVQLKVTLTNTGDYDFAAGDEGYTLTLASASTASGTKTYYDEAKVNITEALAVGESKTIDVDFFVTYSSGWKYWFVKENVSGTTSSSYRYAGVTAYEPKFIFREAGSTSTSSISTAEAWGTITASTSKSFEIANTGTAPLTIKSITLPTGFTSDNAPTAEFTLAKGETQALNITQDATAFGTFSGTLTIVYLDKNAAEQTYTLAFSATVIGANTWTADFNNTSSTVVYPEGSIAEGGIQRDGNYISSNNYNNWLVGRTGGTYNVENNKFITPKLHANAGDQLAFDVKAGYSSTNDYFVKVYVSTDRKTWGNPVAYYTYSTDTEKGSEGITSAFTTKTISFDTAGDYYVAFALYGTSGIDNLVGLEKVAVAHDLYIKSVSWPDASIKSGATQSKPSVDIIPLTNEDAVNYTVKYIYGDNEVAIASKALTASASSTTTFAASFAPSVTTTTTFPGTKVVFEFTDGTKFETETFDLTVTNEPIFHFLNSLPSSKWNEPSDYTTPITFGKTNTADTQSFYLYNWGSAPLTVNSITLPEGFTTTTTFPVTIAAMDESNLSASAQALDITFSATNAGTFSGNMVITYSGDQTFTLAVSGTKLDPTKFYANFDDGGWPAGSVYQSNVSSSNGGTYSAPNYYITSSSTTNNMFVTPKLSAATGDKLLFDAKLYSSYWSEGAVKVYAATTRDEVLNAEAGTTRTQLFYASGEDATADATLTTDYQTFEVPALAGDYFYGFEISNRPYVDEIYGLTVADVAHDWKIASSNIPADAMQNYASTATVNVLNFGFKDEVADDITVTAYVNNVAVATAQGVAIPMNHKLTDAGTQLSVSYMSNVAGTFPVYLEVKAGGYSVQTDPVDVVFAAEEVKAEADMATNGTTYEVPLYLNYKNSESVTMYNAEALAAAGLSAGSKIKKITYKGYKDSDVQTTSFQVYYKWTDDQTLAKPATTYPFAAADNGMTLLIDENHTWNKVGSSTELGEMIVLDFSGSPLTYEAGKSLVIYMHSYVDGYKTAYFEKSTLSSDYCYTRRADAASMSGSFSKAVPAAVHFTLDASAATLSGAVTTSAGAGIEGATVTLKAQNGVEYSGTTAADGSYSFNVIQAGLDFTATVEKAGYLKRQFALNMGGASATQDVTMYQQFGIVGSLPGLDWDNDLVMTQSADDPNIFTAELNNVSVTAGDFKYKLRADGEWASNLTDGYELPTSGDYEWSINVDGTYNFKFTFDWENHTLTFERPFTLSENAAGVVALNWVDVTIEREFKAGWNAVVLPFALDDTEFVAAFGANSEVAVYNGDEGTGDVTVKFKKQDDTYRWIEAGVPYLIWLENPVSGLKFTKDISAELHPVAGTSFDFVGVYTQTTTADGDYFVKGGEFQKTNTTNFVRPFRSYLKLKAGATVRGITFTLEDAGVTTEIDGLNVETPVMVEGVYNLNGQKVQNLKKGGLYIINGKKVVLK